MPYPSNGSEVVFQVPAVDTVAQARDMEVVTWVLANRRTAAAEALRSVYETVVGIALTRLVLCPL